MGSMLGWLRLASSLAVAGLLLGCAPSYFTCTDASDCRDGAMVGMCQPNGACSFDDPSCPSGQRYGSLTAPELAGRCVPELEGAEESGGTSSIGGTTQLEGTTSGSSHPDTFNTTSGTSKGATTTEDGGSMTTEVSTTSDSTTSGVTTDGASTTSVLDGSDTEAEDPCPVSFEDPFPGNELGSAWSIEVGPGLDVSVSDGQLVFTFVEEVAWGVLWTNDGFSVGDVELRLELDHFLAQPYGTEINFGLQTDEGRVRLAICCDGVYAQEIIGEEIVTHDAAAWGNERYLRLRVEEGVVHYEVSADDEQWESIAVEPTPFDLSDVHVFIGGGTWSTTTNPGYAAIDAIELCGTP